MPSGPHPNAYEKTTSYSESRPIGKINFVRYFTPGRVDLEFLWNAARGLLPFQYDLVPRPLSSSHAALEREFFGVCVAEPLDNEACRRALDLIEKLGVGAVRIDCSYGQESKFLDEFVDGLSSSGVDILLHLVQPIDVARQMPEASAVQQWQNFMEATLERFEGKIGAVEVATTINRAKWSGYTLEGFLALWEVSHGVAKARGVTLVGPNITDFEPQYNAGVLGLLAKRGLLPKVHSNNLFAERAIEPEDYDRKILGPNLSSLHGYDLRKKMRLVSGIAARYGVTRNWSSCAFWTLPRINRWLAWPEEQMADYLARFYILCASVGSFERIYWGPLISFREGLIDDATNARSDSDPSARDVVSYYAHFAGDSDQWRCRPGYFALRAVCSKLTEASHEEAFFTKPNPGLEVHAFRKGDCSIYVLWTRNGRYAKLSDCFSDADIAAVENVSDRDGTLFERPPCFFGQSPIYLTWPAGYRPRLLSSASLIKNLVVSRPDEGFDYYNYDEGNWRGLIRARSEQEAKIIARKLSPSAIAQNSEVGSLRKARNAIWTVEDPRNSARLVVVKKPVRMAWHKRILDRRKPSKALRSWNGTSELMRRGINTPAVIAYFESKDEQDLLNNWFICDHFASKLNVRGFFSQYADGAEEVEGVAFETFTEQLVEFVLRLHDTGVFFRDLAGGNVLVDFDENKALIFSLIDTARIRAISWSIGRSQRIADLKRLVLKLNSEQQVYFMDAYLQRLGGRFGLTHRISFKLFALKVYLKRIKRRLRKKLAS